MNKLIVGLVGKIASGKGTVASYLQEKYNAKTYKYSDVLRDILDLLFLPKSRENIINLSTTIRSHFGDEIIGNALYNKLKSDETEIIIIDGIRRLTDLTHFKNLKNFKILAIETGAKNRFERLKNRKENIGDENKTWEEFMHDEHSEAENKMQEVIDIASFKINNDDLSVEELYKKIDNILEKL
jgi:dephospho-CoA kinase